MITRPRKLLSLAGSVGLVAGLLGCGTARPAVRGVAMPSPVTAAAAAPVEAPAPIPQVTLISDAAPAAAPVVAAPEPMFTTPMCDGQGRPLAGNVRGKLQPRECTTAELAAVSVTAAEPGS